MNRGLPVLDLPILLASETQGQLVGAGRVKADEKIIRAEKSQTLLLVLDFSSLEVLT